MSRKERSATNRVLTAKHAKDTKNDGLELIWFGVIIDAKCGSIFFLLRS